MPSCLALSFDSFFFYRLLHFLLTFILPSLLPSLLLCVFYARSSIFVYNQSLINHLPCLWLFLLFFPSCSCFLLRVTSRKDIEARILHDNPKENQMEGERKGEKRNCFFTSSLSLSLFDRTACISYDLLSSFDEICRKSNNHNHQHLLCMFLVFVAAIIIIIFIAINMIKRPMNNKSTLIYTMKERRWKLEMKFLTVWMTATLYTLLLWLYLSHELVIKINLRTTSIQFKWLPRRSLLKIRIINTIDVNIESVVNQINILKWHPSIEEDTFIADIQRTIIN